jgi:hypothetical protein
VLETSKMTDTVEKVDFFKWTKFSSGAGAFVGKLYGGTHEQSHSQPVGLVTHYKAFECQLPGSTGAQRDFVATPFFSFSTVSTRSVSRIW